MVLHPGPQEWVLAGAHHRSKTRPRPRFERAVGNCSSSTRSPLVCVTHLPPSLASWIASWPAFTGRRAYYIWTTSSSSPPLGRSTSLDSARYSSDLGTPTSSWGLTSALSQPRRSTTWVTGSPRKACCPTPRSWQPLGRSLLPNQPPPPRQPKSALSWV